jgi:hypothetical protein
MARTFQIVVSVSHTPRSFDLWLKGCRLFALLFT